MIPVMVVPILTRPDLLNQMLDTVDYRVGTLVIIDNGHTLPGDFPHRDWAENAYVLRMPSNLGVATSWNLGIKATPHAPWWMIVNFDVTFPPGALARFDTDDANRVVRLSDCKQPWSAFTVGEDVVASVGLFDEYLHPAYFEDDDYSRRCEAAGAPVILSDIEVEHANSSTLKAGYQQANVDTFLANLNYNKAKAKRLDYSEGGWSLTRRRRQSWD